jgi:hypothetical protein
MDEPLTSRAATFDRLLLVWNGGDPGDVNELITTDYQGHMLHLPAGERSAQQYPQWIRDYRLVVCLRNSTVVCGYASDDCTGVAGDR